MNAPMILTTIGFGILSFINLSISAIYYAGFKMHTRGWKKKDADNLYKNYKDRILFSAFLGITTLLFFIPMLSKYILN